MINWEFSIQTLCPLCCIFLIAFGLCCVLLRKIRTQ